ncbi:MAG TPA: class I SAM-dependent RNA methyltransferase [Ktedonobacteraceae bacterium]|nr:class I SAM-dependent RNA methyltransferase [Ktedonobacteraceae bacterium]
MTQHERIVSYHTVTLGAMTREGNTLAENLATSSAPGTCTVQVPCGLPGERVTIAVEEPAQPPTGKRKRHWKPRPPRAWISEMHEPSPLRVSAPCPVFGACGGCQLQHMQYSAQLEWKRSIVWDLLHEVGGFDDPPVLEPVPCDDPWHYRNHMRFSVNRQGQAGLTARGTHRVLPLSACPIAHEHINRALEALSTQVNPRPQVLIRCGTATNQVLLQPAPSPEVAQRLCEAGLEVRTEDMEEVLAGETFRIRPSSFFQTNTRQAEKMVQMVQDGLGDRATSVIDAYCGVGTFALALAKHFDRVIAIEESASAIKDAQENLRDLHNVEIRKGKVEDLLPGLASQVQGLVIDPPRAGCQPVVLEALIRNPVARIVYVSCDPATLARDLRILCQTHAAYRLRSVQPLDMFPQTAHIECVAVLECL